MTLRTYEPRPIQERFCVKEAEHPYTSNVYTTLKYVTSFTRPPHLLRLADALRDPLAARVRLSTAAM